MISTLRIVLLALAIATPAWAEPTTVTSEPQAQTALELTVYNSDLALVKDQRTVELPQGASVLRFTGVASRVIPESVRIRSLGQETSLSVIEQDYQFDLISPRRLLEKYVGSTVKLVTDNPFKGEQHAQEALVLAHNEGTVYKIGEEITFDHPGRVIFPSVPKDLIAMPTLLWSIENSSKKPQQAIESAYLTTGMSWHADYVMAISDEQTASLGAWVTLNNQSGATYNDTSLRLVAGTVHRAPVPQQRMALAKSAMAMEFQQDFQEQGLFEYHLYSLERKTTIKDNSQKQLRLFDAPVVRYKKDYSVRANPQDYYMQQFQQPEQKVPVEVSVEIANSKDNALGIALPAGVVRIYKADTGGSLQFVGEDRIEHTPRDERVTLKVGDAFDLVAKRVQTGFEILAEGLQEVSYKVTLSNRKDEDVVIQVIEPLPGDWSISEYSHPFERTSAHVAQFTVPVQKGRTMVVSYKALLKLR